MSAIDVTSRIAMLEARLASLGAGRVGGRGGGLVGSGMDAALAAAAALSATSVATPATSAGSPVTPAPSTPTAVETATAPTSTGGAPAWASALPTAGRTWAPAIAEAADRNGVDQRLLAALVWTESAFDPGARSPAGAIGLGQLMPGTAAELGVDPTDPHANLDGAARYLRQQLDRFGDPRLALAAYNAGPGRVQDAGGVPAIEETRNYVARVTERAAMLGG